MKCPQCEGNVKFSKNEISCARCGWGPSDTVKVVHGTYTFSTKPIILMALLSWMSGIIFLVHYDIYWGVVIAIIISALIPLQTRFRDWSIRRIMIEEGTWPEKP